MMLRMWQFGISTFFFCVWVFFLNSCGFSTAVAACAPFAWTAVAASIMSLNKASAWRIKYRDIKSEQKIRIRIENMGVHNCICSGVYPAGIRCRDLCIEMLKV